MSVDHHNPVKITIDLAAKSLREHIEAKAFCELPSGLVEKISRVIKQEHRRETVVFFVPYDLETVKTEVAAKLKALASATDYIPQLAARAEAVAVAARDLTCEQVGYDLLTELGRIQYAAEHGSIGKPVNRSRVTFA